MVHGSIGHRTGLAIFLALLVPFALWLPPAIGVPLAGLFLTVIVGTKSSVGMLAATTALTWMHPTWWPTAVALGGLGILSRMVKFNAGGIWTIHVGPWALALRALDHPWGGRLTIWRATVQKTLTWPAWLIGHGPWAFEQHGRTWGRQYRFTEVYQEVHNDYLEFAYEHGAVGVAALAWLGWSLLHQSFGPGDPASAVVVAFGVAALVNFPARIPMHLGPLLVALGWIGHGLLA